LPRQDNFEQIHMVFEMEAQQILVAISMLVSQNAC